MRITRVALSFFAVGFVAGTFEQAAGLGDAQRGHRASAFVPASVNLAVGPVGAPTSPTSREEPITLTPTRSDGLAVLLKAPPDARDAMVPEAPPGTFVVPRPVEVRPEGTLRLAARPDFERQAPRAAQSAGLDTLRAALSGPSFGFQRPMSRPDGTAQSPMPKPTFVSLPPAEPAQATAAVSEPQLVQAPKLVRDATAPAFIMPIDKGRVTSMFNQGRYHPAIDLAAPLGTPVHATTRKQRVTFAGRRGGYGNLVITRDPSGRQHYYGHLQRIVAGLGALLEQGDLLGLLGSTGHSTGPHVHYEVRTRSGDHFNPATLLFPGRSVRTGYAWNDARSPSVVAFSTPREAAPVGIRAGRAAARTATRFSRGRATRYAATAVRRYARTVPPRYVTRVAPRYATRMAARSGQPRPR
jgi:murein DD-endopeptidase MepM/ murein hydrolase activator NlpD